jgi:hypothetical protein
VISYSTKGLSSVSWIPDDGNRDNIGNKEFWDITPCDPAGLLLATHVAYSSLPKMEVSQSSEMLADLQQTKF